MIFKIEFAVSRSEDFRRVLSLVRKLPRFREGVDDGAPLYSVEFPEAEFESAQAVMDMMRGWKKVAYYLDGRLIPRFKAVTLVWDRVYADYERSRKEDQKRRTVDDSLRLRKSIRDANTPNDLIPPQQS